MTEPKSREQLERDWWDAWWAADYSWAGLAKHRIGGSGGPNGERSLQDYWRRDPVSGTARDDGVLLARGELVDLNGELFHIVHLPQADRQGQGTFKASLDHPDWTKIAGLVARRLEDAAQTFTIGVGRVDGREARALLKGAVLRDAPTLAKGRRSPLHIHFRRATFLAPADFRQTEWGSTANFQNTLFYGLARFDQTKCSQCVSFEGAVFFGDVSLRSVQVAKDGVFANVTVLGDGGFSEAQFLGNASFDNAVIGGNGTFDGSLWSQSCSMEGASIFGAARFGNARFLAETSFDRTTFGGAARFSGAAFSKVVSFQNTSFVGQARFAAGVGHADGQMRFDRAVFFEKALFSTWRFSGLAYFDDVVFRGDMDFGASVFEKLASFERITWPQDARHWHGAFDQVVFASTLAVSGAGFKAFAAFDGATLERGLQLDDIDEAASKTAFKRERLAASVAAQRDGESYLQAEMDRRAAEYTDHRLPVPRKTVVAYVSQRREERLKQLERGCRVLKQAMELASNKSREQLFYRFELQARRAQKRLPPGEALFSDLYALSSDYGASMVRPFISLLFLVAAFAVIFFVWGRVLGLVDPGRDAAVTSIWQALDLSWANVFKPLSALSGETVGEGTLGHALLNDQPGVSFAVRAVSTLQSLLAIVLAFLFALAVRRRFQIS